MEKDFIVYENITPREKEVLKLVIEGKTNKEIAEELFISFSTAKKHISNILAKFGIENRTKLTSKVLSLKNNTGAE